MEWYDIPSCSSFGLRWQSYVLAFACHSMFDMQEWQFLTHACGAWLMTLHERHTVSVFQVHLCMGVYQGRVRVY